MFKLAQFLLKWLYKLLKQGMKIYPELPHIMPGVAIKKNAVQIIYQ